MLKEFRRRLQSLGDAINGAGLALNKLEEEIARFLGDLPSDDGPNLHKAVAHLKSQFLDLLSTVRPHEYEDSAEETEPTKG